MAGSHSVVVALMGERPPALSVGFGDDMFTVFFSECRLDIPEDEWPEARVVCADCLVDVADGQLARGLDLAKAHGQVDWDVALGEWFVPEDVSA